MKVWDVMSGRELHSLSVRQRIQGSMMASIGVYFIGFASDNRLVTVSDAITRLGSCDWTRTAHARDRACSVAVASMALTVE